MEKDVVQMVFDVAQQLEMRKRQVELLTLRLETKNSAIESLETKLYRQTLACKSAEKKSDVSLMFFYSMSVLLIIDAGFFVARLFS